MALTKVKISDLPTVEEITISGQENMEIAAPTPEGSEYPYVSRKLTFSRFGNWLGNIFNFNQLETTAKTLVGAINEVNDSGGGGSSFWDTIPNNAGAHNAIYRGKNLGDPANINWNTIDSGEFEDMFIGDYWEIYDEPTDQTITWRIAAFDYYRGIGGQGNFAHHITVIPDQNIIHSSANIKIFENKGISALTGYMYSNIKGYKVYRNSFIPSDFTYNSTDKRWEVDTGHSFKVSLIYLDVDGDIKPNTHSDLNLYNGILYKYDSTGSNPPQFTTATLAYSYKNDTDVQTITETFTNADVLTSGWSNQYNTRGYIKLGHMPISENYNSILEVLVDGVSVSYSNDLRGYYLTSNTSGSYLKDAQTIQVTYKYGNNYGGINQASRIIERAFGLNSHIMQTGKILTEGSRTAGSLGYFGYTYTISDIDLPSEQQIMGNRTIGVEDNWTAYNSGSAPKTNNEQTGESSQLPLFALNPSLRCNREGYWLKDRCYATPLSDPYVQAEFDAFDTHYLCVNPTGEVTAGSGSGLDNNPMGIRPVFNLAKTQSYGYPQ